MSLLLLYYRRKWKITKTIKYVERPIRELLDASYQGVKRLYVLAYDNAAVNNQVSVDSFKKYFLPRVQIKSYNIEIGGRKNFYYQSINDLIKKYDEVRKVSIGQGDDDTTSCLLDYRYFKDNYRLIAFDSDSRAIQQIIFTGKIKSIVENIRVIIYYILEQSNQMILQFLKEQQING